MASAPLRTRLAPTPSGLLHPGNGLSFIMTWAIARAGNGHIVLRIDDLDKARTRKPYVEDVFRTLEWLGLDYDEGPVGVDHFFSHWSQHTRLDHYEAFLQQLRDREQLFACICSRKQIRSLSVDGSYPGTCLARKLDFGTPKTAWRIRPPASGQSVEVHQWREGQQAVSLQEIDAFVVRQKNGFPAYQLASLVDDEHFRINFVVRGADLWASTLSQLYLAGLLGAGRFQNATFWHHELVKGTDGEKLSKSKGAGSLQAWREAGESPAVLFRKASTMLGLTERAENPEELVALLTKGARLP
ncbi:glutamate--tRNA ligase family protein [Phaeodactylibacter sp.]|uniref:glutamate--tRNA ligase family protein n=1 Tax=Phaeodactylibacter sp. TaxID=1940289 RepID=UPI0025CF6787|nr:glutamate--tRNA ligase family protein [Phaeodactylibacter sp.]MCI4649041.1 glutamate--tRNA ligase family protein [Phaeodactylibacter sp.]MCI5091846.1 glutamate--tRNA ligase family protein [Phaeodactylibacter sp.]